MMMGPFIRLSDGAILAVDENKAKISVDEGQTWETHAIFADEALFKIRPERALIQTKAGTVILAFMNDADKKWHWDKEAAKAGPDVRLPTCVVRSHDGGKTWDPPVMLHHEWTGAIRNMIETSEGHIVFTSMMITPDHTRHCSITYASKDDGATWNRSNFIDLGGRGHHDGGIEPAIVELRNGRLWMLIRTTLDKFWEAHSDDGGMTWRTLGPTAIDASTAPAMVQRLASGRLVLVWNRLYRAGETDHVRVGGDNQWSAVPAINQRAELCIAFSADDGATWTEPAVIATAAKEYSYPYLFEAQPGELWLTTMRGVLRAKLSERDFVAGDSPTPYPAK